ncbi:uncharacterized protein KY384_005861 [Bacidia gigantensis]|uniref:uncharacterized protein n=1 Tax=Bacidia gigantensis TaxID=2732470 RepID=UPI001D053BF4|nr:uncharacterized protein KY384_005861 [Bacidia gigantensis]KAG8529226.1 hypothetical protein KY384_005861 [Bacidia gigantensis]
MSSLVGGNDFAQGVPNTSSPLSQSNLENQNTQHEELGSSTFGDSSEMRRTHSGISQSHTLTPSRGGTLKKKSSINRKASVKRSGSRKSSRPSSVKDLTFADGIGEDRLNDAFYTPVPTQGSPTEILANRFQGASDHMRLKDIWRKVLKDLITYFRDLQKSYDARSKSLYSLSNVMSNITAPPGFIPQGGISDAYSVLRDYHKKSISEGNKAKTVEEDVIVQLTGLRSDLGQKVKEIKGLSGDFKNNVDKETEGTRRAIRTLEASLADRQPDAKNDPYLIRLGVERQLERQIEEENYLHRAFLNLESSGRELESIVMGEIQKAYNAYAGILKRESDEGYEAIEDLQTGPLALAKDYEWTSFVSQNDAFIDPRIPVRKHENITYPGKEEPAAAEVRAGMLERKSKYLKSYTPGWYVLTPTHIHEFKSPDRLSTQAPVMSLPLIEQKLGSRSSADSTSHKFMLKGRQSGGLHKSHAWVFRAESYDTMMAWFSDIKNLTEKTGIERDAFIRRTHARSISAGSVSEGSALDEDEADQVPYSAAASQAEPSTEKLPQRPNPGGRFPSNLNIHRDSQVPLAPSSPSDNSGDRDVIAAAGALPSSGVGDTGDEGAKLYTIPVQPPSALERHDSKYGEWMAPTIGGAGGMAAAAAATRQREHERQLEQQPGLESVIVGAPATVVKSVPPVDTSASAQAAVQLSNFSPIISPANNDAVDTPTEGQSLLPVVKHSADPAEPLRDLADRPVLNTQDSMTSSKVDMPGGYPASRISTQQFT